MLAQYCALHRERKECEKENRLRCLKSAAEMVLVAVWLLSFSIAGLSMQTVKDISNPLL